MIMTRNKLYIAIGAVAALAGAVWWKKSKNAEALSRVGNRYAQKGAVTDTQYAVFFELLDSDGNLISIRRAGAAKLPYSSALLVYTNKLPASAEAISRVFGPAGVAPATSDQEAAMNDVILDYLARGGGAQ